MFDFLYLAVTAIVVQFLEVIIEHVSDSAWNWLF